MVWKDIVRIQFLRKMGEYGFSEDSAEQIVVIRRGEILEGALRLAKGKQQVIAFLPNRLAISAIRENGQRLWEIALYMPNRLIGIEQWVEIREVQQFVDFINQLSRAETELEEELREAFELFWQYVCDIRPRSVTT